MTSSIDFSPGPSQLYYTVEGHLRNALKLGVASASHRSKAFERLYGNTTDALRELLELPDAHHVFFVGSATEIWERLIQNGVAQRSFHLVNGAFSKKCYATAVALDKQVEKIEAPDGQGFGEAPRTDAEMIAVTHNETSTGVALPMAFIDALKDRNPGALLAVDAVSSLPYARFDYSKIDSVYFSVQKGFGLPPGLGVWIVNDRYIAKSKELSAQGKSIGSYHSLPSLSAFAAKRQTPCTPNTLGIYLLGKVAEDMLEKGAETIRRETAYKAALLYQTLKEHELLSAFVKDRALQSPTVIVAEGGKHTDAIIKRLSQKGITVGGGYGAHKGEHLRIANFPTHSKEQVEYLVDTLNKG